MFKSNFFVRFDKIDEALRERLKCHIHEIYGDIEWPKWIEVRTHTVKDYVVLYDRLVYDISHEDFMALKQIELPNFKGVSNENLDS
jgi:uncharacterized protein with HEPN domain